MSEEFTTSSRAKVRRPYESMVAMLRTLDADLPADPASKGARALRSQLERMGHPLHERPSPDGYPDADGYWVGSDGLLNRWSLAGTLARNRFGNTTVPAAERVMVDVAALVPSPLPATIGALLDAVSVRLTGRALPRHDLAALCSRLGVSADGAATTLTSTNGAVPFVVGILLAHPTYHRR
jgi:hypothetical protein